MSTFNRSTDRLRVRAETAAILTKAIDGHRQEIPLDASTLSRYCNCDCANALEMVAVFLDSIPADRGAMILGFLEDFFEGKHSDNVGDFFTEYMEAHDADTTESNLRGKLRRPDGSYCPEAVKEWEAASFREAKEKRDARLAWRREKARLAESRGRKPAHRAGSWTQTRKERTG